MPLVRNDPSDSAPNGPPLLAKALASGNLSERWTAVRSADSAADIPLLAEALASESDTKVRLAIFGALARIATQESASVAVSYIASDDASIRTAALDSLRAMPKAAAPFVTRLLADRDADVRLLACDLIRDLADPNGAHWLDELLDREESANVCAAAIEVLAEIGDSHSIPALRRCEARFRDDAFLAFAIQTTAGLLGARSPRSRG